VLISNGLQQTMNFYSSLMHYENTTFAKPGRFSLKPRRKEGMKMMGQRKGFSPVDIQKINLLYNCNNNVSAENQG